MLHFLIEITYSLPIDEIGETQIGEHRQFLQTGYERGLLLMSGPQAPPLGGIVHRPRCLTSSHSGLLSRRSLLQARVSHLSLRRIPAS
jgi:uncharacterized protein YciI